MKSLHSSLLSLSHYRRLSHLSRYLLSHLSHFRLVLVLVVFRLVLVLAHSLH
jgi:hypothetical protein